MFLGCLFGDGGHRSKHGRVALFTIDARTQRTRTHSGQLALQNPGVVRALDVLEIRKLLSFSNPCQVGLRSSFENELDELYTDLPREDAEEEKDFQSVHGAGDDEDVLEGLSLGVVYAHD